MELALGGRLRSGVEAVVHDCSIKGASWLGLSTVVYGYLLVPCSDILGKLWLVVAIVAIDLRGAVTHALDCRGWLPLVAVGAARHTTLLGHVLESDVFRLAWLREGTEFMGCYQTDNLRGGGPRNGGG